METLKDIPNFPYLWGTEGKNPYLGFLACADNLIVTGDSVSMCCEATATQKPLRILTGSSWLTNKHLRFVQSLYEKGFANHLLCSRWRNDWLLCKSVEYGCGMCVLYPWHSFACWFNRSCIKAR